MLATPESVLRFWFGDDLDSPETVAERCRLWFTSDAGFDARVRERFAHLPTLALRGELDEWRTQARSSLALVLVLDQLPRNLHRGSARAFGCDAVALEVAREALECGFDAKLAALEAGFFYLPFEHCEDPAAQGRCVALFEALLERAPPDLRPQFRSFLEFARRHRDVIARFGRFPHRNAVLGRASTTEERAYLEADGETFGGDEPSGHGDGPRPRDVAAARRKFAAEIARRAGLTSSSLRDAFAAVPREAFLGPGPWQVIRADDLAGGYRETPDADPIHLYELVLVAIDASRLLNNGEPVSVAGWLDRLAPRPGMRFLHVGCGTGYYSAVVAHAVSPGGSVLALETEKDLAARARGHLADRPAVEVRCANGSSAADARFDAIFVNAGATEVRPEWLEALAPGGRLLVPLTVAFPTGSIGAGHMLLVEERSGGYAAGFVSPVGIYHCTGARSDCGDAQLRESFGAGGACEVASLRRASHPVEASCWLHTESFCLSRRRADAAS